MRLTTKLPSTLPQEIYYFRHGQSVGNALGLDDVSLKTLPNHKFPLTNAGFEQATQLRNYLALVQNTIGCKEVYVSTFLRAQLTLDAAIENTALSGLPRYQDSRLDEWWKGIFHSLNKTEIQTHYPLEVQISQREGWHHYSPPQGEAGKEVEARIQNFLKDLTQTCLIAGHGRYAGFLKRILCNEPIEFDCKYTIPDNCELWLFRKEGDGYKWSSEFKPVRMPRVIPFSPLTPHSQRP